MNKMRRLLYLVPLVVLILGTHPLPTHAAEFRSDTSTTITDALHRDLFTAGQDFNLKAPLTGELFAVGNTINLNETPGRSAYLAGSNITIEKGTAYNVFAAGGTIIFNGEYGNDIYVVGNDITFDKASVVKGDLWISGTNVTLAGTINGTVHMSASNVTSSAVIGGDVTGTVQALKFTGGSIAGALNYKSDVDADGLSTVKVTGITSREPLPNQNMDLLISVLFSLVASFIFGALLVVRFPSRVQAITAEFTQGYGVNLAWGLVTLAVTPLLLFILLLSGIGIKIGFAFAALFVFLLILAGVLGLFIIGRYVLAQILPQFKDNLWAQLLAGALLGYLIRIVPYVGMIVTIVLFFIVFVPVFGQLLRKAFAKN